MMLVARGVSGCQVPQFSLWAMDHALLNRVNFVTMTLAKQPVPTVTLTRNAVFTIYFVAHVQHIEKLLSGLFQNRQHI